MLPFLRMAVIGVLRHCAPPWNCTRDGQYDNVGQRMYFPESSFNLPSDARNTEDYRHRTIEQTTYWLHVNRNAAGIKHAAASKSPLTDWCELAMLSIGV